MQNRSGLCLAALCVSLVLARSAASHEQKRLSVPPGAEYEGAAFTFHKIAEGVYHAVGTGNLAVGSNGAIIVNERDVLVVDSHITPAAAWALLEEMKSITDKPVRYLVNTHFHFDHVDGNQVFPEDVEIIGHEFTREMIVSGRAQSGRAWDSYVGTLPGRIEEARRELESTTDTGKKAELQRRLDQLEQFREAVEFVKPTPPTTTLAKRLTLHRGGREIQLLYFGRGHTGGDVVVYIPKEKVLVTGDLLTGGLPYMGDGFFTEWVETLEYLKALEVEIVLPGHGAAFEGKERIDHLQAYLRDLWNKATTLHEEGFSAEEAAGRIDMRDHAAHFSSVTEVGVDPRAVLRIYELLDESKSK